MTPSFASFRTALLRHSVRYHTGSSCNFSRGAVLIGSTSFLAFWTRQSSTAPCAAAANTPPPRFGMSVRYRSDTSIPPIHTFSDDNEEEEDCPICRKYSQGPCGDLFKKWLKCTDANKGVDPETKQELHVEKCLRLATPLAECLQTHQDFYDNLNIYNDDEEEEVLLREWTSVVKEVEESCKHATHEFPTHLFPILEIRPSNNTGMAAFVYNSNQDSSPLTLAYVKDADTGDLLAAGSLQDLWEWQDKYGVLRLVIPPTTRTITAFALYQDVLYSKTQKVPQTRGESDK